ncbi:hypothetical protein OHB26_23370 [Nocardia sp. NBC_01503]|uniref:hypothetical protein n=1 Tax=Nocardia sp. NBC_01503 TaxID=2975997 RepID=UPI002E7B3A1D|nr:hypothetical protein [Nocardia sp. NBC_01503]WTL29898.1 hypothetical protein OHB26_23370 [Nocardia sp. NBC_01503]
MELATAAGDFLIASAERLALDTDPETIRATLHRACGGQLNPLAADGYPASRLTSTGVPFEASVTGGGGRSTPALRYVTEAGTIHADFGSRLTAQLAAIDEVAELMPNNAAPAAETLRAFVAALYPDPADLPACQRFATWLGVVHRAAADRPPGLKLYGSLRAAPDALPRLCAAWPEFTGLAPVTAHHEFIEPCFAAIEVDAHGALGHKVYLKARYGDIATPMKLVRHFGDPAWEVLSELVRCGADPADLHHFPIAICRGHRDGATTFALHLGRHRGRDLTPLVRELAARHHGSTAAVDALAGAAESTGATWRYSVVGLGCSSGAGIDKLNVYGTPSWDDA